MNVKCYQILIDSLVITTSRKLCIPRISPFTSVREMKVYFIGFQSNHYAVPDVVEYTTEVERLSKIKGLVNDDCGIPIDSIEELVCSNLNLDAPVEDPTKKVSLSQCVFLLVYLSTCKWVRLFLTGGRCAFKCVRFYTLISFCITM